MAITSTDTIFHLPPPPPPEICTALLQRGLPAAVAPLKRMAEPYLYCGGQRERGKRYRAVWRGGTHGGTELLQRQSPWEGHHVRVEHSGEVCQRLHCLLREASHVQSCTDIGHHQAHSLTENGPLPADQGSSYVYEEGCTWGQERKGARLLAQQVGIRRRQSLQTQGVALTRDRARELRRSKELVGCTCQWQVLRQMKRHQSVVVAERCSAQEQELQVRSVCSMYLWVCGEDVGSAVGHCRRVWLVEGSIGSWCTLWQLCIPTVPKLVPKPIRLPLLHLLHPARYATAPVKKSHHNN